MTLPPQNYLFRRKAFGLSPYWPTNAELLPYESFVARATLRGKLFPSSFFPQLLSVGSVPTATHLLRTDGRLVPKGQTGNSPMLQGMRYEGSAESRRDG